MPPAEHSFTHSAVPVSGRSVPGFAQVLKRQQWTRWSRSLSQDLIFSWGKMDNKAIKHHNMNKISVESMTWWGGGWDSAEKAHYELNSVPPDRLQGFLGDSAGKESACKVRDLGSIPGLGRSPGEGKGFPLQYSGPENSMDCIVHGSQRVGHDSATFTFTNRLHGSPNLQYRRM